MELQHIADRRLPAGKQQFRDIEDDLLYVLDEKGHTVHLTDAVLRRLDLGTAGPPARGDVTTVLEVMAGAHGWSETRQAEERAALDAFYVNRWL